MIKKVLFGLLLCTGLTFAQLGVKLEDPTGNTAVPAIVFTNVTTPQDIRQNSAQDLYAVAASNPNGSMCFVELFNSLAADVLLGTTAPVLVIPISQNNVGNFSPVIGIKGFDRFVSIAFVKTPNGTQTCDQESTGVVVLSTN